MTFIGLISHIDIECLLLPIIIGIGGWMLVIMFVVCFVLYEVSELKSYKTDCMRAPLIN